MKNHKQRMQALTAAVLLVITHLIVVEANAVILYVDQANTVGGSISFGTMTPGQYLGQSFTPTLSGLNVFEFSASSKGTSTTQLKLFSGETTFGVPIATSETVTLTNTILQMIGFQFSDTVAIVPGSKYTARLDLLAGDSYQLEFSNANPYAGGWAFDEFGVPNPTVDAVFSEGLNSIPEPSTFGLLALGSLLLGRRWRKSFDR